MYTFLCKTALLVGMLRENEHKPHWDDILIFLISRGMSYHSNKVINHFVLICIFYNTTTAIYSF